MMKLGNENPFKLSEKVLPGLKSQHSLFEIPIHIDPKKLR